MKYERSKNFRRDFRKLPQHIQQKVLKALLLFEENPRHPSLQTHIIRGAGNPKVFEGYVDRNYRFTFHYEDDTVVFRRVGPHSIIDQESP
jgi:mRNA-degrading endonuclease RelE of RelBE toxin-antitoxin system